jgi:hypothetical protein
MTATRDVQSTASGPCLHLTFELSGRQWKLAFTIGYGQPARLRTLRARNLAGLLTEIHKAKRRFDLPDGAAVVSCYEAGRDGFWPHRWLISQGGANVIVESVEAPGQERPSRCRQAGVHCSQWADALPHYSKALELSPTGANSNMCRAHRCLAYAVLGQWDNAAADLVPRGIEAAPLDDTWFQLAYPQLLKGDTSGHQQLV